MNRGPADVRFHDLGVGWRGPPAGAPALDGFADQGRYEVTGDDDADAAPTVFPR